MSRPLLRKLLLGFFAMAAVVSFSTQSAGADGYCVGASLPPWQGAVVCTP